MSFHSRNFWEVAVLVYFSNFRRFIERVWLVSRGSWFNRSIFLKYRKVVLIVSRKSSQVPHDSIQPNWAATASHTTCVASYPHHVHIFTAKKMSRSSTADFETLSKIGSGSFGTVYKVRRIVDQGKLPPQPPNLCLYCIACLICSTFHLTNLPFKHASNL